MKLHLHYEDSPEFVKLRQTILDAKEARPQGDFRLLGWCPGRHMRAGTVEVLSQDTQSPVFMIVRKKVPPRYSEGFGLIEGGDPFVVGEE